MKRSTPETLAAIKEHLRQNMNVVDKSVEQIRSDEAAALDALIKMEGFTVEKTRIAGMRAEWIRSGKIHAEEKRMILYFHGGAFIAGSCDTHRDLAARLSHASAAAVLVIEYRLAPEHQYPAANEDCFAAYRELINSGISPRNIVLGGDSVGGTLAIMTLLSLRDAGEPLPAGVFLLSPHTDFIYFDSESYHTRAGLDPTGSLRSSQLCAAYYLGNVQPTPPILSPLTQNLKGLPEMLLQVGDQEVLHDECVRFAVRTKEAGGTVTLKIWENMWCGFQLLASLLPEGQQAINQVGEFVKKVTDVKNSLS